MHVRRVASRDGRNEKPDWLRRYRPFANGALVDDAIVRVAPAIDPIRRRTACGETQAGRLE